MISPMYFDTAVDAYFVTPDNKTTRYNNGAEPSEHYRSSYGYSDDTNFEIGYKAVGSIGVDFRQYLQFSSGAPERHNDQEQNNDSAYARYQIKNYAYNTPADLKMTVNLPSEGFETYYLKVDPRVKDYVKEIKLYRADGCFPIRSMIRRRYGLPMKMPRAGTDRMDTGESIFWTGSRITRQKKKGTTTVIQKKSRTGKRRSKKQRFVFLLTSRNTRRSEA